MTPERWLWLGLVAGLALALSGVLSSDPEDPGAIGAVATVDGVPIPEARFEAAMASAPPGAEREAILDDLIAEELLVAWALELDLPRRATLPRAQLLREVTAIATAGADDTEATDAELRAFYDEHPEHFRGHRSYAVEALWFRGPDPTRAKAARDAWSAGGTFADLAETADSPTARLPTGPVPAATLRDYLGPSAVRALDGLEPGGISEVLRAAGGHRVVRLVERRIVDRAPFATVRDAVASRQRSERRAARLRAAVSARRAAAEIAIHRAALEP